MFQGAGIISATHTPLRLQVDGKLTTLFAQGDVVAITLGKNADAALWVPKQATGLTIDLSDVQRLDTAGALLIAEITKKAKAQGIKAQVVPPKSPELMTFLTEVVRAPEEAPPAPSPASWNPLVWLNVLGIKSSYISILFLDFLSFLGHITSSLGKLFLKPNTMSWRAMVAVMFKTGVQALPIVGVMSFVIGVILAYQGSFQLAKFGADIFTIDLLGVSVLREIGVLMAAIMVAGRSGSAFAAQIGTMKLREEIDAMATMGLSPMGELVLPRIVGLTLVLPLLVIYADFMGLLGGAMMSLSLLNISTELFIRQLHSAIEFSTFWVGLVKAPVFGFLIALIGCYEGWQVSGSAESVGAHTTRAVVESIFLIVIFDGIFSILFALFGV